VEFQVAGRAIALCTLTSRRKLSKNPFSWDVLFYWAVGPEVLKKPIAFIFKALKVSEPLTQ
jgi:hypothetical protein